LRKIFEAKRKWAKANEEGTSGSGGSAKEVPSPPGNKGGAGGGDGKEGKVFVRADLNYTNSRKEG